MGELDPASRPPAAARTPRDALGVATAVAAAALLGAVATAAPPRAAVDAGAALPSMAQAGSAAVAGRWPVPRPTAQPFHPYGLAYADADTLLVARPDVGPRGARNTSQVVAFDRRGRGGGVWASELARDWLPTWLGPHPGGFVLVGDRERAEVQRFDGAGRRVQRWRLRGVRAAIPEPAAVGPDGSVWILSGLGPGAAGQRVDRLLPDGSPGGGFVVQPRVGGADPPPYASDIAVDDAGRLYLWVASLGACGSPDRLCPDLTRPRAEWHRFLPDGTWLGRFGAPDDALPWSGWHDESSASAGWPAAGRLVVGRADPVHLAVLGTADARLIAYAVAPQAPPLDRVVAVASQPGSGSEPEGGFAALVGFGGFPNRDLPSTGHLLQFGADGTPLARTVYRAPDDPVFWDGTRLTSDDQGRIHVLLQDDQVLARLAADGTPLGFAQAPSWPVDVAAGPGGIVVAKGSSGAHGTLEALAPDGTSAWLRDCACDEGSALAVARDQILSGESLRGVAASYDLATGAPGPDAEAAGVGRFWPTDLAGSADGWAALDEPRGQVDRWTLTPSGSARQPGFPVEAGAQRLDRAQGGTVAVLHRGGLVAVHGAAGERTHRFRVADLPGAEGARPVDVAWGAGGRLLLVDAAQPSVIALDLGAAAAPALQPPADSPVCTVSGDKVAAPQTVWIGEPVTVTLTLSAACPSPDGRLELALVLGDLSYGTGEEARDHELAQAQLARRLIRGADLGRVQIAVFQDGHGQHAGLTANRGALLAAVDRTGQRWPYQEPADWTAHLGVAKAAEHLQAAGRPGARRAIVLVLRRPAIDLPAYAPAAQAARAAGLQILVVPFTDGDEPAHAALAGDAADVVPWREALTGDALAERLALGLRDAAVRDVVVDDALSADVRYRAGSAAPAAQVQGARLIWTRPGPLTTALTLTLSIDPLRPGDLWTNDRAFADYTDADGTRRRFVFPVPRIRVLAPTPTAEPTPTPKPVPLYLPRVLGESDGP